MNQRDDAPLGYLLRRAAAALRPEVSRALRPLNLSLSEFVCLRALSMHPGISSAQLSRHSNVTPQAMNTVLHRLVHRGAVIRPATVPSGRPLPATLTGVGRELLQRAEDAVRVADERILTGLTATEQCELRRMLERIGSG